MGKRNLRRSLKEGYLIVRLFIIWFFHYYIGRHIYNFFMSPYTNRTIKYQTFKKFRKLIEIILK